MVVIRRQGRVLNGGAVLYNPAVGLREEERRRFFVISELADVSQVVAPHAINATNREAGGGSCYCYRRLRSKWNDIVHSFKSTITIILFSGLPGVDVECCRLYTRYQL